MSIRSATIKDLEALHAIEIACFPPNQAASLETLERRLNIFPQHFWLIEEEGKIIGFINGMITDYDTVQDIMFKNATLHNENGSWQSVFGLAVAPAYQKKGYARMLLDHLIEFSRKNNRKGITLTCEKHLIPYYEKAGFINAGLSASVHGGDVFYDMQKVL